MHMTRKEAIALLGGELSHPGKMPCQSFDLPVSACKLGSILARIRGTVCSGCYAAKGFAIVFKRAVDKLRARNLVFIRTPSFIPVLVTLVSRMPYFRWHSAGDIQDTYHLASIVEICKQTPNTIHWLPTRELDIIKAYVDAGGTIPSNLVVRVSGTKIDGPAPKLPDSLVRIGIRTSTVNKDNAPSGKPCAAQYQNGKCLDCRVCWNTSVKNVSYKYH